MKTETVSNGPAAMLARDSVIEHGALRVQIEAVEKSAKLMQICCLAAQETTLEGAARMFQKFDLSVSRFGGTLGIFNPRLDNERIATVTERGAR